MELFKVVADSVEDSADLAAQAVGIAHRTQNGVLDATGVNDILAAPIKDISDKIYDTNENLVRETGRKTATLLRKFGDSSEQVPNEENSETEPDNLPGAQPSDSGPYPSRPDHRDHIYEPIDKPVDNYIDLRDKCPEVYSQKAMNSCVAHAVAAAFEFDVQKQGLPAFSPSRLFIWYNARAKSDNPEDIHKDVGSNIKDAIKSLDMHRHGVCSEEDWSYEVGQSDKKTHKFYPGAKAAKKPPTRVEHHAHQHTAPSYRTFPRKGIQKAIIQYLHSGYPVVFGMKTYGLLDRKYINSDGRGLRHPTAKEMKNEHRHSLLVVGYNQEEKLFIVRNSWGANWGENGYFYMPYDYLKHCYDFWTIRLVNSSSNTS
ncbi:cysteine proteinase [Cryphonectria parasitica EP155]|uniref:Cysteine proteinase n=1 Tax=Cryphonectria parasitica (strain ATCC 38755 / EP155) TaxID=660469 RepID=A0A9P5CR24_CRYP1|nr:cysteine proteinase [Cryphonectria parasitica EP155]KAF3767087.1 cysteine proteinase [Cryphonectria parasitica EP155]